MIRLGILGSTRGTHLIPLIEAIKNKTLDASIDIVISNKSSALILEKAVHFGLQSIYLSPQGLSRKEFDQKISNLLNHYHVDLVVLIGYMRILSGEFIHHWRNKIINTHPSLLPAFAGLMDLEVHRAVLEAGEKQSGCTIHFVTEDLDSGPIILQRHCDVLPQDTPEQLKARVQALEGALLVDAIRLISQPR